MTGACDREAGCCRRENQFFEKSKRERRKVAVQKASSTRSGLLAMEETVTDETAPFFHPPDRDCHFLKGLV